MKSRKWIITGIALAIVGAIIFAWVWNACTASGKKSKKEIYPFYQGLELGPKISKSVIDKTKNRYVMEPVLQGDLVQHDFMLKNDSQQPLELKKVQSCCGSLVDNYTRRIEPGETGVVSVVLLTDRYGGQEIHATVLLTTSDAGRPEITIDISCYVKKFADISEHTIMLDGSLRQPIEGTSMVVPADNYPFSVTGIIPRKGIDILYSYEEIQTAGRKGYRITAKNKREKPGVIRDILFVQTDHPAKPEFKIRVQGKITE